ncbi:putative Crossover junction endonuclease MUS81 [Blattamonas nauphoetae]|uniref:Crossover junction endonuclease MUS81 n=1 Tax=Blattamonas nauphoetae TaxID=2049346 RepID=A0ABQ9XZL3_9EUKA|nr:putative Crossover junction endonuclease MUS81 [Blattamonas nauphoetae]
MECRGFITHGTFVFDEEEADVEIDEQNLSSHQIKHKLQFHQLNNFLDMGSPLQNDSPPPSSPSPELAQIPDTPPPSQTTLSESPRAFSPESDYEMVLIVDNRERRLLEESTAFRDELLIRGVNAVRRSLAVGDMIWIARRKGQGENDPANEIILNCVVERKIIDDLLSSIVDTRFEEQRYRLSQCGCERVIYLIEGEPSGKTWFNREQQRHRGFHPKMSLDSALRNLSVVSGFVVHRTKHNDDSVMYLTKLTSMLAERGKWRDAEFSAKIDKNGRKMMTYFEFQQKNGKAAKTVSEVWKKQLMHVPNVSAFAVDAITAMFPTPHSIFSFLQSEPSTKQQLNRLSTIRLSSGRTLTKKAVSSILSVFGGNQPPQDDEDLLPESGD